MEQQYTHSKRYHDEELRAKAICTVNGLKSGQQWAAEIVMNVAVHARMHPHLVVEKIRELSNIQL